jgi:hypothetical protein
VSGRRESPERVLGGILGRLNAPGGYEAFCAQVRSTGCCRRPVRLAGRVARPGPDGHPAVLFDSAELPDGVLLKACGTRRETVCPPCASLYRGDTFALVAAGLRGGKGVPEDIGEHPAVLLTLTAPSFGAVHRRLADGSCHLAGRRCPHGVALVCAESHHDGDGALGSPLCAACYDYEAAVLFNAGVSELWRRTMIYALRALGQLARMSVREAAHRLRLSYVKVVEFQRRGSVHIHALVRIDVRGEELGPPPAGIDADMLVATLRTAARKVSAPAPGGADGKRLSWGRELEVAVVDAVDQGRRRAAAYLGKYASKGTDEAGVLDHRLRAGIPKDARLPAHLRRLVQTAWTLSGNPGFADLHLRLWAHSCGFRGHFLTKSRAYSTTFGALRAERQAWRISQKREDGGAFEEEDLVREWRYEGCGYLSAGDVVLAENLGDEARLGRRVAREDRARERGKAA